MKTKLVLSLLALALCLCPAAYAADAPSIKTLPKAKQAKDQPSESYVIPITSDIGRFTTLHVFQFGQLIAAAPSKPSTTASLETLLGSLKGEWKISGLLMDAEKPGIGVTVTLSRTTHDLDSPAFISLLGFNGDSMKQIQTDGTVTLTYDSKTHKLTAIMPGMKEGHVVLDEKQYKAITSTDGKEPNVAVISTK